MFFTQEDYNKIYNWIKLHSIKDSEFSGAKPLDGREIITVVQQGYNVKFFLKEFLEQLSLLNIPDFVNVTNRYNLSYISLFEAIKAIPYRSRKIGQVITFIDEDGNWRIYQFKGERVNQWNILSLWVDILQDIIDKGNILPDEEDLAAVKEGDRTVVKFKDKPYNPDNFSGKGRVYLRKNITEVIDNSTKVKTTKNLLVQSMIGWEDTYYFIQYDYDLNGQTITIPKGSKLIFIGGSINNGTLNCINTTIQQFNGTANLTGNYKLDNFLYTDDEDITKGDNRTLKFADRVYNAENFSGKGYKILRKNIVGGKNVLTQEIINEENTVYEIRYDFDLNGGKIIIPNNSHLIFAGGSITNGSIDINDANITFNNNLKSLENCIINGNFHYDDKIFINVRDYGCKCDANYYDSETNKWYVDKEFTQLATDDSDVLQFIINGSINNDGIVNFSRSSRYIFIPNNICLNKPVKLQTRDHIFGKVTCPSNWGGNRSSFEFGFYNYSNNYTSTITTIVTSNNPDIDCLFHYDTYAAFHDFEMSFLGFNGNGKTIKTAIKTNGGGEICNIHDCYFEDFDTCIELENAGASHNFNRISLFNSNIGILVKGGGTLNMNMISGDNNNSLIKFYKTSGISCVITSIKSEVNKEVITFVDGKGSFVINGLRNLNTQSALHTESIDFAIYSEETELLNKRYLKPSISCKGLVSSIGEDALYLLKDFIDDVSIKATNFTQEQLEYGGINAYKIDSHGTIMYQETYNPKNGGTVRQFLSDNYSKLNGTLLFTEFQNFSSRALGDKRDSTNGITTTRIPNVILVDATNGTFRLDFLPSNMLEGQEVKILRIDNTDNNVTFRGKFVSSTDETNDYNIPKCGYVHAVYTENGFAFFNNNKALQGNTSQRPTNINIGYMFYDKSIKKPIWWTGTEWVDSEGNDADSAPITSGTFANKPTGVDIGYAYFCTDRQTTEGSTNGIMIYCKGDNTWVDALGRTIS